MVDLLTAGIAALNFDSVTAISEAIDVHMALITLLVLSFTIWYFNEKKRLRLTMMTLVIALVLSVALKEGMRIERPCEELNAKVECPSGK